MKALTLLPALLFGSLSALAADPVLETPPNLLSLASQKVFDGSFETVVCVEEPTLKVRGADLLSVLFTVPNYSAVKVFQGWGENKKTKMIEGERVTFVKVQFPSLEDKIGWIADYLVRPRSRCNGAKEEPDVASKPTPVPTPLLIQERNPAIRGLDDPACCQFPVKGETTEDFNTDQRRFGAGRGNRLHAACDLYRYKNEPILSVAPGKVLRNPYPFYQGTHAVEIRHSGGFVVRYGEVTPKRAEGMSSGRDVKMGQVVGFMGKVNSNCCEPMLHFELYSGAKSGSLSTGGNRYQRRSDLMNPTSYLRRWEENSLRLRR